MRYGDRVRIRFKDLSMSQDFRCTFAWSDGLNSVFYDEEGYPILIAKSAYEVIKEGWIML